MPPDQPTDRSRAPSSVITVGPIRESAAVWGLVLAAGAGTRFGGPKALARDAGGVAWVQRVVLALRGGGCEHVVVVLGAGATDARALVPPGASVVRAAGWARGLAHSFATGLDHVIRTAGAGVSALAVAPVDVPAMPAAVVARVLDAGAANDPSGALARATYAGTPGHPVLLGTRHWGALLARLPTGTPAGPAHALHDVGAGPHLAGLAAAAGGATTEVECGHLWDGLDIDTPQPGDGS